MGQGYRFFMYLQTIHQSPWDMSVHHTGCNSPQQSTKSLVALGNVRWLLQVVKQIWAYIKEHDLQNPQDRRKIIPDEVLGTFLTAPVNMMSMNSQLSKHCFTKGTHTLLVVPCVDYACTTSNRGFRCHNEHAPCQITYDVPHHTHVHESDRKLDQDCM